MSIVSSVTVQSGFDPSIAEFVEPNAEAFDVDGMDVEALNHLPVGAIKVDAEGRIAFYNETESRISGRAAVRVIGRRFFHEIAPCTNMPNFYGRFRDAVVAENAHVSFLFVFDFAMRPIRVRIDMRPSSEKGLYWILVRPVEFLESAERTRAAELVNAARVRVVGEAIDYSECDRELIHQPDAIQPHGALIAIDPTDLSIQLASANLESVSGASLKRALGQPAALLFPEAFLESVIKETAEEGRRSSGVVKVQDGEWLDFLAHRSQAWLIMELQRERSPLPAEGFALQEEQSFLEEFYATLIAFPSGGFVAQGAAERIRKFTGVDRVLIYQFDPAGNGCVIAEDKETEWDQSLVGLNFPASDVPKQARALYLRNRVRHVPNNAYVAVDLACAETDRLVEPLDLSFACLRSVSPLHREYQRNMGVLASFSASILVDGALWGLVIGHHRLPLHLSRGRISAIERAAELLGPRLAQAETQETLAARLQHEKTHRDFIDQLATAEDLLHSFERGKVKLTALYDGATGAVAQIGGQMVAVGRTPSLPKLQRLVDWLHRSVKEDVWATDCISGYVPDFLDEKGIASGALVCYLTPNHLDLVIWFRPEAVEAVTWAGDPAEKARADGSLLPRKRFERWIELKSAHSRPWAPWKLELANRLSHAITSVLSAQLVKLKTLNEKLELASGVKDRFLAQMSHELRTPLNAVIGFSELIATGFAGPTTDKQKEYLGDVLSAGKHLLSLINDILEISRLEAGKYVIAPTMVNVLDVARRAVEMLSPQASQQGVRLEQPPGPPAWITTDERALTQVMVNLLSNGIKFTKAGGFVRVAVEEKDSTVEISVCDSGIGMDEDTLSKIGAPFYQAQHAYRTADGTGLGLSIVQALVKANGGEVRFRSQPGVGTTVTVALPKVAPTPDEANANN
ncbi:MAG: ATP-binding protein [Elsteraceae bacterium]